MSFLEKMEQQVLGSKYNVSFTENGARGYKTTGEEILDMNFKISSYRNKSPQEIVNDFKLAYLSDKTLAIQFLFFIRDREEGLGERRTFRIILESLASKNGAPEIVRAVLPYVAEYGRWDDLFCLISSESMVKEDVLKLIRKQMIKDYKAMEKEEPVSLLFKWLPSCRTSSEKTRALALEIRHYLGISEKRYRVALSKMRKYIDVVEKKMSKNQWQYIEYSKVPSKANLIYKDAFLRHDTERRTQYLNSLKSGETKINSSKLFPYEIYHKVNRHAEDETLQALWDNLPNTIGDGESVLCVADGSASMTWERIGKTGATPLDVANSLAIYFAERAKGEFKDTYITFSSNPQIVSFKDASTLAEKKFIAEEHCECANTNIAKTFQLILDTATKNFMYQSELPTTVLILSDMEFDCGANFDVGLFQEIEEKFNNAGYKMPKLVFWNICGRTDTIPMTKNENGVILVSGFSTTIFNMVLGNETDPMVALLNKLNSKRYLPIKELVENIS